MSRQYIRSETGVTPEVGLTLKFFIIKDLVRILGPIQEGFEACREGISAVM